MSMPGAIETNRHYNTIGSFRKDELSMVKRGWTPQAVHLRDVDDRLIHRLLHSHASQEVDVRYLRLHWPA